MGTQRRRNTYGQFQKERFLKVIKYDPELTFLQARERFGISYVLYSRWKIEALGK